MKKLLSLLVVMCLLLGCVPVSAEDGIEELYLNVELKRYSGNSLSYDIIFDTNCPEVYQDVYYPDGTQRGKTTTYSGSVLEAGGLYCSDGNYWDYDGEYLMVFRYGDLKVELIYTIENSDRYKAWWVRTYGYTPEDKTPTNSENTTNKSSGTNKVSIIEVSNACPMLDEGAEVEITVKSSKTVSVEVEDEEVVAATLSNGVLKITGLKMGESAIWLRNSDTYTTVDVIVCYDVAKNASEWARDDVRKAIGDGFVPSELREEWTRSITREEFAKMAVRFLDLEGVISASIAPAPFTDTENPYVLAAYEAGIVKGAGERKFNPIGNITRQEAAVMLMRVAKYMGAEIDMLVPEFNDNDTISSWAVDAVGWVQETGIMQGDENGNFNPLEEYTVEQSIVTFVRLGEIMTDKNI